MLSTANTKRVALVTGATHGIGYQVAYALATSGANVIVHARSRDEGHHTIVRLIQGGIEPLALQTVVGDFARLDDVRALAERVTRTHSRLDLLVNNAATVGGFRRRISGDGNELTLQVNYLAHYLLTRLLWAPLCAAPGGRVVNLSSAVHRDGQLSWEDLNKKTCYVGAPVGDGAQAVLRLCDTGNDVHNGGYYEGSLLATPAALVRDQQSVDRLWRVSAALTGLAPDPEGSHGRHLVG